MNRFNQFHHSIGFKAGLTRFSLILPIAAFIWLGFPSMSNANPLPTRIWESQQTKVLLPDWSQTNFSTFPPATTSGSAGNRSWQAGDTLDQILQLGDIRDLKPEIFSLEGIKQLVSNSIDPENTALSAFPLVSKQTISHLVEIVPNLGQLQFSEVPPIAALASQLSEVSPNLNNLPLDRVVEEVPQLAQASLDQIDLSGFSIAQIPNLTSVNIEQFSGWETSRIADIPNLNQVPLSRFPIPVAEVGGGVMRIDTIYGAAESKRENTISGSDVEGFAVACAKNCAYIELDDMENSGRRATGSLEGKQWISGKYQEVRGGSGCLTGWEPTGRHPFGKAFKVVVMEPSEIEDTVDTALYFRFSLPCGKSPYIIGPIPFLNYQVNSPMFVGLLEGGSSRNVSRSTGAAKSSKPSQSSSNSNSTEPMKNPTECVRPGTFIGDVDAASLGEAIANLESAGSGDYQAIGTYICADGGTNCGMALGRYQLMSYREDVQQAINSVSGGAEFLKQVNSGKKPRSEELFRYFPPAVQDQLLRNTLAKNIARTKSELDPTTGQLFSSDRLIERVAQKHFGGEGSKIDANYSDIHGGYSLKSYGEKVRQLYNHNTKGNCFSSSQNSSSGGSGIASSVSGFKRVAIASLFLAMLAYFSNIFYPSKLRSFWMLVGLGAAVAIACASARMAFLPNSLP
ncbi:MAG TPA: hypothetical protein DDW76_32235 [Cyanobacteria bacterium UBA11369]|nr:hypothetical protein [Cyanobacteria bacterium UBA11371]HBE31298.1 hypothetical protein [Cyanobacteria bacterium UBA11368]HBE53303.1 hypothetical protein [Cyanobacteria bacterium UBA11369]